MRRQVRIASSVGRPSRRKTLPGMNPAAYFFSSTSTVSGKKSRPSRTFFSALAVTRTTVSPILATMAPCDCGARTPVSNDRVLSVRLIGADTEMASAMLTPSCVERRPGQFPVVIHPSCSPGRPPLAADRGIAAGYEMQRPPTVGGRRVLPAQPEAGVDLPQSLDVRLAEIGLEA